MIIDNFYVNPDAVRNYALSQEFSVTGNYPGSRTKPYLPQDVKDAIQYWLPFAGPVTNWFEDQGYTGAFQIATAQDRTWIHADHYNMWAGVCYLTPMPLILPGLHCIDIKPQANIEESKTITKVMIIPSGMSLML